MLFPEEDAPLLKTWIVKRIENTSDADSDVLADYVIALLKHDGDAQSVRQLCEAEIPDFLTEDSKAFLDDVFQAIAYKSYRPGAPPPPKSATGAIGAGAPPLPAFSGVQSSAPHQGASRKRGFADDMEHEGPTPYGRGHKQARRGSNHGRMDDPTMGGYVSVDSMPGMKHFDPKSALETIMQMQAMGLPYPGMAEFMAQMPPVGGGRNSQRRRGRCRDFDTKGYCSRGNQCMYDHGNASVYVPPMFSGIEEYDPSNAVLGMSGHAANPYSFPMDMMGRGRGRGNRGGRGGRGGKKGGARAPFSAEGPVNDRTKSTIVIENIPEDHFDENEVRTFFSQFGEVVEVSMQPYKHLAIVKYDKWASANAAYRSPKVIFDNRFVKVFWYKEEGVKVPSSATGNGDGVLSKIDGDGSAAPAEAEPEIDMEEFQRMQEEAQKKYQEREAKRTDLERQRQELEKQQQELLARHREESERLKARLAEKSGATADAKATGSSSSTDMLRAQLAALEQEAKILGIDPDAAEDGSGYSSRGRGFRGRGGRGSDRGFAPRGRGSFRGQAGRHAAYAQYSLDNRPRKLAVTGVDFTPPDKDEALRHFLLNLGEFESVETNASVTHVSFQDRKTAEKFHYSLHGKELPGVSGTLELSWINTPLPPVGSSKKNEDVEDGDAMAGLNDEEANADEGLPEEHMRERQVDMDYEVDEEEGEWVE
ncbi:hypothetical protein Trisim1_012257 [Trichoderma cf. simile WF8]|uniref:CCCH zinc finger and RRM domain-containing protein n=1 Tax=Trichoderma guizhouense TaxID=1491466 RepID=A0A1T3CAS9_9HYPO|nr:hypothetical protein A0O28_0012050 [Trichoderma guizhouense]